MGILLVLQQHIFLQFIRKGIFIPITVQSIIDVHALAILSHRQPYLTLFAIIQVVHTILVVQTIIHIVTTTHVHVSVTATTHADCLIIALNVAILILLLSLDEVEIIFEVILIYSFSILQ